VCLAPPARQGQGYPRGYVHRTPYSRGWRSLSRTWRRHAGRASSQRTPWCARDPSPGSGTWPPPIKPAPEIVWWGARNGRVRWMRVVSLASARGVAGTMVVNRCASTLVKIPCYQDTHSFCIPTERVGGVVSCYVVASNNRRRRRIYSEEGKRASSTLRRCILHHSIF
jgi:hypothetical protein